MARDTSTDLRTRVDELEATVRGLTQELVEADERIRQLEATLEEPSTDAAPATATDGGPADDGSKAENGSDADELDDIIVA